MKMNDSLVTSFNASEEVEPIGCLGSVKARITPSLVKAPQKRGSEEVNLDGRHPMRGGSRGVPRWAFPVGQVVMGALFLVVGAVFLLATAALAYGLPAVGDVPRTADGLAGGSLMFISIGYRSDWCYRTHGRPRRSA